MEGDLSTMLSNRLTDVSCNLLLKPLNYMLASSKILVAMRGDLSTMLSNRLIMLVVIFYSSHVGFKQDLCCSEIVYALLSPFRAMSTLP